MRILRRLSATAISSMVSALLFCVAFSYPEKVFASAEDAKWSGISVAPLFSGTQTPGSGAGDVQMVGTSREDSKKPARSAEGVTGLQQPMAEMSLSVVEQPVSDELAAFVDSLRHSERRLFLTLLDDPTSAALLLMAAQNPRFDETIRHFRLVPAGVQREYLQSQHVVHDAMSNTPRSYRGLNVRADLDEIPLLATLDESAREVFYDGNTLYLSHLLVNLVIWTGTGFSAAAQGSVVPAIWQSGAQATIFESNMAAACDLVEGGREGFMLHGPLIGGLELSSQKLIDSACFGIGMAALPAVAHNLFMPLVVVGVLSMMKLAYGVMEHRKDVAMDRSALEDLGRTIKLLEQRLGDVDMERLVLADETRIALEEIAKKPGELLPIAVGISRLSEQDFEEVSAAVIAITNSLDDEEITESNWKTTLMQLLHIQPHKDGQPRTSGIFNALYHMFADRGNARIYAPLVLGYTLALTLHVGSAVAIGILAPHVAVMGQGAAAIITPTTNLSLLCQTLSSNDSMLMGANVSGTVVQVDNSGLGILLNTFAASFLAIAMSKFYDPIQRLFSNQAVRGWAAWLSSLCGDRNKNKKEETEIILLRKHAERLSAHTRSLRRRTGTGQQGTAQSSGLPPDLRVTDV